MGCVGNTGSGVMGAEIDARRLSHGHGQEEEAGLTLAQLHVLRSQEEQFLGC